MPELWCIIDIIKWAESYFKNKNFENPRAEIEWLLRSLLGYSRLELYLKFEEPLSKSQLKVLRDWVKRRINKEPLQYITKSCDFYGREFFITKDVLIPRPETERLVDVALEKIKDIKKPVILDIGTGSGCIGLTLAMERPDSIISAIDNCQLAIKIAEINKSKFLLSNINFSKIDILNEYPSGPYDLIVSNPPYISKKEMSQIMADVKNFEPKNALTDQNDGLTFYRYFSKISKSMLKSGSYIITEVGRGKHPHAVKSIFDSLQYLNVELIKDYNGDNRVLIAKV